MWSDARALPISDLVSFLGIGRAPEDSMMSSVPDRVFPTMALGRFLDALKGREAVTLLDLGGAVGANVTFFCEQLGCKLFVEDLFADLDRLATEAASGDGERDPVQNVLASRITQEADSVDGVLCWDTIEHLTAPAGRTLAASLARVLRPGGVLLTSFGRERCQATGHTKYEIIDRSQIRHRFQAGTSRRLRVLQSREVIQMFSGLAVVDSFLLKTQTREMIFRKPASQANQEREASCPDRSSLC